MPIEFYTQHFQFLVISFPFPSYLHDNNSITPWPPPHPNKISPPEPRAQSTNHSKGEHMILADVEPLS